MLYFMSKQKTKPLGTPRERIMRIASDLFYQQGYRATGINEVIDKSGVAKATFYNHFPSKDDLALAYLEETLQIELISLDRMLGSTKGVENRLLAVIKWLKAWLFGTDFRGCAFMHMVAEEPDVKSPLRKPGRDFYDNVRQRVELLVAELIESNAEKYGHLKVKKLTEEFMIIFAGAISQSELYYADWPVEHALRAARKLFES